MNKPVHIRKSSDLDETPSNCIHYVPCKINFDGDAKVSQYFLRSTKKHGGLEASFRGHPLKGKVIQLPEGYKGLLLEEQIQRSDDQERSLYATKVFNEITYWNWDKVPTQNDVFLSALDWIDIAKALHSAEEDS